MFFKTSSNYYPQCSDLVEFSNKNIIRIIKRTLEENQRQWHLKLGTTLWDDRITPKRALGNSPFMLVYGREESFSLSFELPSLDLAHQLELLENDALSMRYVEITELEESEIGLCKP